MDRITVKTSVRADIDKVWLYWTKNEHIKNWNFATDEWCCPKVENDLKPNGKFVWRMEAKDGGMGFDFTGTYDIVIDREMISYHLDDSRKVEIEFTPMGNEVNMRETFDTEATYSKEQQREGWQAILDNFKKYVESN
ncbi:SRPBCC domain-containing protein [Namhaeicola litoreus]|uniref:SRPBCC domain-containing protein n=1 Tax=Namhaeicola litoreus TaxID=1052145 RepID=A0ABW3Y0J5_9FLAO